MPYFVMIDDAEMKMILSAMTSLIRHHERQLTEILRERVARRSEGKAAVFGWRIKEHDELLNTLDELDIFGDKLKALPTGRDRDLV